MISKLCETYPNQICYLLKLLCHLLLRDKLFVTPVVPLLSVNLLFVESMMLSIKLLSDQQLNSNFIYIYIYIYIYINTIFKWILLVIVNDMGCIL